MLEKIYAAQEDYEQRLADAERSRRYSHITDNSERHSVILRRLCITSGNLLIALGTRLKALPLVMSGDEPASEISR